MSDGHYAVRAEDFERLVTERDAARVEADRLRARVDELKAQVEAALVERDAYIDALDTIRRDHSLVGLADTVLNRYGRLYPEDGDDHV